LIGPAPDGTVEQTVRSSPLNGRYETMIDRESAYEILNVRAVQAERDRQSAALQEAQLKAAKPARSRHSNRQSVGEAFAKTVARSVASRLGTQIVRGLLGSLFRK
jgi:hypothetical protein